MLSLLIMTLTKSDGRAAPAWLRDEKKRKKKNDRRRLATSFRYTLHGSVARKGDQKCANGAQSRHNLSFITRGGACRRIQNSELEFRTERRDRIVDARCTKETTSSTSWLSSILVSVDDEMNLTCHYLPNGVCNQLFKINYFLSRC